jgi:hypothetical protein
MEGVMEAFGYSPASKEISKGIIRLAFEKTR